MSSQLRFISSEDINRLTTFKQLREVMADALRQRPPEDDSDPHRFAMKSGHSILGIMPGSLPRLSVQGIKIVSLEDGGHAGLMILFDSKTGLPKGIFEAGTFTSLRTAAVSAAVTELFIFKENISTVGILGSGAQAKAHIEAFADLSPQAHFQVFARSENSFRNLFSILPEHLRDRTLFCKTPREAAKNANVICTLTRAETPLLDLTEIPEYCHINAVGSCLPNHRELSSLLVANCERFVDSLPAAKREAGDLLLAIAEGTINEETMAIEIGALLKDGARPFLKKRTLFKSLGLPCEDLAFADFLLKGTL